jgi:hypothetical protein
MDLTLRNSPQRAIRRSVFPYARHARESTRARA